MTALAEQPLPPAEAAPRPARRLMKRYAALALVIGGIGLWRAISAWQHSHAFLINVSPSLPNWAFVLETRQPPGRGSLVFFKPPRSPVLVNNFGPKPQLFGKYVYGVPGDVVTRKDRIFFVNGRQVAIAKTHSRKGEPLPLGPTGVVPPDCYFVGTPHKDGFDSRYGLIGFVCRPAIIGTGKAVL